MAAHGVLRPPQSPGTSHTLGDSAAAAADLAEMASSEVVIDMDVTRVDFMDVSPELPWYEYCREPVGITK